MKSHLIPSFIGALLFGLILPALVTAVGWGLDHLLGLPRLFRWPINLAVATPIIACGLWWMVWSYRYIHFVGRGTPLEAFGRELAPVTRRLVTTGPYAYTRNPMVFGWLTYVGGLGVLRGSPSHILLVMPLIYIFVRWYLPTFEEPGLERRFGEEYRVYRRQVPLLFPRRRRR